MKLTRLCLRATACLLPVFLVLICVVTPMILPAAEVASDEQSSAGEVRISDTTGQPQEGAEPAAADPVVESSVLLPVSSTGEVKSEVVFDEDAGDVTLSDIWSVQSQTFLDRNRRQSEAWSTWVFYRLGLYTPASMHTAPIGSYRMVYPVDPRYVDPRDSRVYGAQGAGIPIVVPLAPNVGSGYNYGSGLPASRLTPISVPR
jgi:hypothetical protein